MEVSSLLHVCQSLVNHPGGGEGDKVLVAEDIMTFNQTIWFNLKVDPGGYGYRDQMTNRHPWLNGQFWFIKIAVCSDFFGLEQY